MYDSPHTPNKQTESREVSTWGSRTLEFVMASAPKKMKMATRLRLYSVILKTNCVLW